jgi:hypothetical protein
MIKIRERWLGKYETDYLGGHASIVYSRIDPAINNSSGVGALNAGCSLAAAFEVLNGALVLFRGGSGCERAEIFTALGTWIDLARI